MKPHVAAETVAIRRHVNLRARGRLFCFPYSGGGASVYARWAPLLPESLELCAAQPPGREDRLAEPFASTVAALIDSLRESVCAYLDLPFVFFGHSSGAIVAFELARSLRAHGLPTPQRLIASACCAPHLRWPSPALHELPDHQLAEELRRLNGMREEALMSRELMELLLPRIRADLALLALYRCDGSRQLDCPVTAIGGLYDRSVSRQELLGWGEQTTASFRLRMVPGDHFYVNNAPDTILPLVIGEAEEVIRDSAQ